MKYVDSSYLSPVSALVCLIEGLSLLQVAMQRYVEALHADLVDMNPEKKEHIIHLILELCDLNLYLAMNTGEFSKFICQRLDANDGKASQAPISVWRRCLVGFRWDFLGEN